MGIMKRRRSCSNPFKRVVKYLRVNHRAQIKYMESHKEKAFIGRYFKKSVKELFKQMIKILIVSNQSQQRAIVLVARIINHLIIMEIQNLAYIRITRIAEVN